jgi:hypothetical protein
MLSNKQIFRMLHLWILLFLPEDGEIIRQDLEISAA